MVILRLSKGSEAKASETVQRLEMEEHDTENIKLDRRRMDFAEARISQS